jgi:hypothetical protein
MLDPFHLDLQLLGVVIGVVEYFRLAQLEFSWQNLILISRLWSDIPMSGDLNEFAAV